MDSELEKLLNSNSNLEEYINQYGDNSLFLYYYFLQDTNRINKIYYAYCKKMSLFLRVQLAYRLLETNNNKEALRFVFSDVSNYQYVEGGELVTELFKYVLKLVKEHKINLDDYGVIMSRIIDLDPAYFLNKDFNYIKDITFVSDYETLLDILEISVRKKYKFTEDNFYFINDKILTDTRLLIYFINNCDYDDYVTTMISKHFDNLYNDELFDIYNQINNKKLKETIVDLLNFDNVFVDTIIDHEKFYLMVSSKEDSINLLKKIKEKGLDLEIILIVDRVDIDFIDEARKMYRDDIKISPLQNQEHMKVVNERWNYPCYTVDQIKKSEETLDLYAKTVNDKKDIDGDIKSLSPLEKFIAAYILTTKFARYKEEKNNFADYHTSRSVYELVDRTTNRSIVCVGYVHLLMELLYRMGLKDTIRWDVHSKKEDRKSSHDDDRDNHSRMLIHLVDPKYGIDGVYMSDPTWDESFFKTMVTHMLMSRDELKKIDPEFTDFDLRLHNIDDVESDLNIKDINALFNKQIPKETIVKAFLAVNRFLDKNMKMAKDDSEYSFLEYWDMSIKLGILPNRLDETKIVDQLVELTPNDIVSSYPNLISIFNNKLVYYLEKALERMRQKYDLDIYYDEKKKKFVIGYLVSFNKVDSELVMDNYRVNKLNRGMGEAIIYELDDRPVIKQYQDILNSVIKFNQTVYTKSFGNKNVSVK